MSQRRSGKTSKKVNRKGSALPDAKITPPAEEALPVHEPERNPTYQTLEEYLANRDDIQSYAWDVISGIQAKPKLQETDMLDILSYVGERCYRYFDNIPRGRGQRTYVRRMVLHGLYELQSGSRPIVILVLAPGAVLTDLLPKSKANKFRSVQKGFWANLNAFEGPIDPGRIANVSEDERVLRIIFVFEGFVRPAPLTDENEEVAGNSIEALASVDPFRRVCMRLDEEAAREELAETNSIGAEVYQLNVGQGMSFRKISAQGKYSNTFYCNRLRDYRRKFRERFPELGSDSV